MRRTALVILGDLAVDDGTFAQVTREKGGSTQKRAGHYSAIFRRENGRWLLWRDDATSDAIEEM
jgi:ketosteroid isomerase-like protein